MLDPRMMMGPVPDVPSQQELWKSEKDKYRLWIILFGVGILIVIAFYVAAFAWNFVERDQIKADYIKRVVEDGYQDGKAADIAKQYVTLNLTVIPIVIIFLLAGALVVYVIGIYDSYKSKTFAKLSGFPNVIISLGALFAAYSIIQNFWMGGNDFNFKGTIFMFVTNILFIVVWIGSARQVAIIRRTFLVSKQVEDLKKDPNFQAMQAQVQQMMGNQQMGPFGPVAPTIAPGAPNQNPAAPQPVVAPEETVSQEEKELRKMTLDELREVGHKLSISGADNMEKNELITAIIRVTEETKE